MDYDSEIQDRENAIVDLNGEISSLQKSIKQYQNMNENINKAIKKLEFAKRNIKNARDELNNNYTGKAADKKIEHLQNEQSKIENYIRELRDSILLASRNKITSLNGQIGYMQQQISGLTQQMQEIRAAQAAAEAAAAQAAAEAAAQAAAQEAAQQAASQQH